MKRNYEKKNILLVSDLKYFKYAEVLIKSIFLKKKNFDIYYFLITKNKNFSIKKSIKKNVKIFFKKELGKGKKEMEAYYANSRLKFCKELFLYHDLKHLMYIDVDSIVKKDISSLYKSFLKKDCILQIKKRSSPNIKNKFMTGVFLIKKNTKFLNLWLQNLHKIQFKWFGDQISLYHTSVDPRFKKKIVNLKSKYIDYELNDKSYIWSGRSGTKNYYKYRAESFLIKFLYNYPLIKKYIDNNFFKIFFFKIFDFYDQFFTKRFRFLFTQKKLMEWQK